MLGLALLCVPNMLQAQTAEERAREQELRQRIEERLQVLQEKRLVRIEEVLAQARAQAEHAQVLQGEVLARQLKVQAENLARVDEARLRYEEAAVGIREKAREARARAQEQVRRAQQVVLRVRSRIRLGVSLDGTQGSEIDGQGAKIQSIIEDSPAEEAGLQEGDIITHLNGHRLLDPIPDESEKEMDEDGSLPVQRLIALAQELDAGDEVEIRYLRDGSAETVAFEAADVDEPNFTVLRGDMGNFEGVFRFDPEERGVWNFTLPDQKNFQLEFRGLENLKELEELKIELEDLSMAAPNFRFRPLPEGSVQGWTTRRGDAPFAYNILRRTAGFGLELAELNPGLAEYFSSDEGLLVLDVEEDSTLGLLPGDVILAIDGREVEDQGDVRRILGSYEDEDPVSFTVVRKGGEITVEGTIR